LPLGNDPLFRSQASVVNQLVNEWQISDKRTALNYIKSHCERSESSQVDWSEYQCMFCKQILKTSFLNTARKVIIENDQQSSNLMIRLILVKLG
jgi:hypothetical protein